MAKQEMGTCKRMVRENPGERSRPVPLLNRVLSLRGVFIGLDEVADGQGKLDPFGGHEWIKS